MGLASFYILLGIWGEKVNKKVIDIYISNNLKSALNKYILKSGLDLDGITINKLIASVIKEWVYRASIDRNKIIKATRKDKNGEEWSRIGISLDSEIFYRFNSLYLIKYFKYFTTKRALALNIVEQWAEKNIHDYSIS